MNCPHPESLIYTCILYISMLIYIFMLTELVSYMYPIYMYIICTYLTSYLSHLAQGTDLTEIARLGPKVSEE